MTLEHSSATPASQFSGDPLSTVAAQFLSCNDGTSRRKQRRASIEESLERHVDTHSNAIISASIAVVGLMIIGLGMIADVGTIVVAATGGVIVAAAALLFRSGSRKA